MINPDLPGIIEPVAGVKMVRAVMEIIGVIMEAGVIRGESVTKGEMPVAVKEIEVRHVEVQIRLRVRVIIIGREIGITAREDHQKS